jgi:uncharacterized membrane protein (UPF0127 family)
MAHFLSPLLRDPAVRWHLVNETRGTTIATVIEGAFDSRSRRKGLLGRDHLPHGHALVVAPSNAVHSFFMRFSIDVLFVDRAGTVLRVTAPLARCRLAAAFRAFAVVELAAGAVAASQTSAGDRLALIGPDPQSR